MFIDSVSITVQAGNGGQGCESFHHRNDRKIVSNGGDGGNGAGIIFRADHDAQPLAHFRSRQHIVAESGGHGGSNKKRGKNGDPLVVLVPPGTRLFDKNKNLLIRYLRKEGDQVVVVEGGKGGSGNFGGKKNSLGEKGQILTLELSFIIPADLFLVGLPNSGKSKLLNFLTRSHIKEEAYPFTTSAPQIATYETSNYEQLALCELPSLYNASHEGKGLGAQFLKHLEGAPLLVYVLDPVSQFSGSIREGLEILRHQLELFSKDYLKIPFAVIINKIDLPEAKKKVKAEKIKLDCPVFYISAETGEGVDKVKAFLDKISHEKSN